MGHVITTLDNVNTVNHAVMGLIYVFHMPLFIIISGYLTKNPERQQAREMWRGVGNIFVSLPRFPILLSVLLQTIQQQLHLGHEGFPFGILWYLGSTLLSGA